MNERSSCFTSSVTLLLVRLILAILIGKGIGQVISLLFYVSLMNNNVESNFLCQLLKSVGLPIFFLLICSSLYIMDTCEYV